MEGPCRSRIDSSGRTRTNIYTRQEIPWAKWLLCFTCLCLCLCVCLCWYEAGMDGWIRKKNKNKDMDEHKKWKEHRHTFTRSLLVFVCTHNPIQPKQRTCSGTMFDSLILKPTLCLFVFLRPTLSSLSSFFAVTTPLKSCEYASKYQKTNCKTEHDKKKKSQKNKGVGTDFPWVMANVVFPFSCCCPCIPCIPCIWRTETRFSNNHNDCISQSHPNPIEHQGNLCTWVLFLASGWVCEPILSYWF